MWITMGRPHPLHQGGGKRGLGEPDPALVSQRAVLWGLHLHPWFGSCTFLNSRSVEIHVGIFCVWPHSQGAEPVKLGSVIAVVCRNHLALRLQSPWLGATLLALLPLYDEYAWMVPLFHRSRTIWGPSPIPLRLPSIPYTYAVFQHYFHLI